MPYLTRPLFTRLRDTARQPAPAGHDCAPSQLERTESAEVSNRWGTPVLLAGVLAIALALARFAEHAAGPLFLTHMFDLGIYRDGGLIARHAYPFPAGHARPLYAWVSPGGNPFTYPPFAAEIFAVLSFLPLDVLRWSMTAAGIAALVCVTWLTLAGVGVPRDRTRAGVTLIVSAIALWTQPVQANLGLGQINLLLMVAIIWDLQPTRSRPAGRRPSRWWAGAATGIAAGIKLTPLIFVPYLLVTRRFKQAAVASGAFAATVLAGFAGLPGASMRYWSRGLFARADGGNHAVAFFFASARNQSLRGMLSRLLGHAQTATDPWLVAALVIGVVGLLCAAGLESDGFPLLGLLTCALTALLVSPVSWDHHWVWVAPWLAAMTGMAVLGRGKSRWAWGGAVIVVVLTFAEWPAWSLAPGKTAGGLGLIRDVPMKTPFSWQGLTLIAGNLYVIAGVSALLVLLGWSIVRSFQRTRTAGSPGGSPRLDGLLDAGAQTYSAEAVAERLRR